MRYLNKGSTSCVEQDKGGKDTCHAWTAKEGVECKRETFRGS